MAERMPPGVDLTQSNGRLAARRVVRRSANAALQSIPTGKNPDTKIFSAIFVVLAIDGVPCSSFLDVIAIITDSISSEVES